MKGHLENLRFLKTCFEKKFPHSWIFFGPSGVGKYEFTLDFIKNVTKVNNLYQNVYEINNYEKPALIEDIRELISQIKLTNTSSESSKTFFLIHQLETLNLNCMNALLKTIEEPPENTVIIIFTQNLRNIPKTILSRCVKLKFKAKDSKFFTTKEEFDKENFLICNYNSNIFNILNNKKGKEIKDLTMLMLKRQNLELNDFYLLYERISENFYIYFFVIVNVIFYDLKTKISSEFFDSNKIKSALFYLDFIKKISNNDLKLDKKILHLMFAEYFRHKLNN